MADRDTVSTLSAIDVNSGAAQALQNLKYSGTPDFKIVLGPSTRVSGFSTTSHKRISELNKLLDTNNNAVANSIASLTGQRINDVSSVDTVISNDLVGLSSDVNTKFDTLINNRIDLSSDISTEVSTQLSSYESISVDLNTYTTEKNTKINETQAALGSVEVELSNSISTMTSTREASYDQISADYSQDINVDNTNYLGTEIASIEQTINDLSGKLSTDYSLISDAISTEYSNMINARDDLSTLINDNHTVVISDAISIETSLLLSSETSINSQLTSMNTAISNSTRDVSSILHFTISNSNPSVFDSLSELLTDLSNADSGITADLNVQLSVDNLNHQCRAQRLDYLEKFCYMVSEFVNIVHDDNGTVTNITFPATTSNLSIYESATALLSYDSTIYPFYVAPGYETAGDVSGGSGLAGDGYNPVDFNDGSYIYQPLVSLSGPITIDTNYNLVTNGVYEPIFTTDGADGTIDYVYAYDPSSDFTTVRVYSYTNYTSGDTPTYVTDISASESLTISGEYEFNLASSYP